MDILSSTVDFSQFKYLCFIDSDVESAYKFSTFLNDLTYPIVYSYESDRESLKTSILTKFTQIERISFVFHGPPDNSFTPKQFINNEPYFDLDNTTISDNNNSLFLEELFVTLNVQHADFLACNLLQQQPWKDYFASFGNNVTIGASEDATGNLKYGGDWMMENTMEDVRDIYFKSSIENFAAILLGNGTVTDSTYFVTISWQSVSAGNANKYVTSAVSSITPTTSFVLYVNNTFTAIGASALINNNYITTLIIHTSITIIKSSAFYNCINLANVTFENIDVSTLDTIQDSAFQGCTLLTSISIPASCTSIGLNAFQGCSSLNTISFLQPILPAISSGTFPFINNNLTYVNSLVNVNTLITAGLILTVNSFSFAAGQSSFRKMETSIVTVILNSAYPGFSSSVLTVQNGSVTSLTSLDNITWSGLFTPSDNMTAVNNTMSLSSSFVVSTTKEAVSLNYSIYTQYPSLLSKSMTALSAYNTTNSASTQRFQMNLDNTSLTSPIMQSFQDISQNALGYTSSAINQRFIFGSCVPNNPLELNSTVNAGGSTITSSVKASNFLMYSDVRLKQNIEGLSETQGIDNIRAVQYNNKNDDSKHFGVIAQELAEIYPELVHSDEKNMQSVSYIELIPICINEIQLLKKRQDALQLRLNTVRSRINQLKN